MDSQDVCRGSWALGTACGRCARCDATRPATITLDEGSKRLQDMLMNRYDMRPSDAAKLLAKVDQMQKGDKEDQANG